MRDANNRFSASVESGRWEEFLGMRRGNARKTLWQGYTSSNPHVMIRLVLAPAVSVSDGPRVRRSFHRKYFRETGKAVRTGHSCAAVSHHKPPPRVTGCAGKANRSSLR